MRSTSFTEWLGTLSGFNATMVNRLWRALGVIYPVIYLILAIGTLLSSWGLAFMNWGLLFFWISFAIAMLVSPWPWQLIAAAGLGKEVLGGEEGFEFEDWFSRVKTYSRDFLELWTVYVLVCPSVAFIYLALSDTTNTVGLHLVLILVLTLCIFISVYLWPKSKTVVRFLMACIIILCLILLCLGIKNTVQRQLLDPATRTALEANEAIEAAQQAADKKRADTIHQKLRAGHKLSAEEQKWWNALQVRMREQGPLERLKSLWQSPTDKARKAAEAGAKGAMDDRLNKLSQTCYLDAQASNKVLLPGDLDRCTVEFITRREQCLRQVNDAAIKASEPAKESDLEQCRRTGSWTATPVARPASAPAHERAEVIEPAPRPTRTGATDPNDWTCTPFKEFDYDPQNQFRLKIETGAGKYEIEITGMRRHVLQRNIMANGQRTDGREWYAECLFDPDGRTNDCKERKGEAIGNALPDFSVKHKDVSHWIDRPLAVPIPTEPYGKVIVRTTENKVIPIGSKGRFETRGDSFVLDLNVDPFPTNYQGIGFKGVLRRCEVS